MSKGVEMIAAERKRQIEVEGWTPGGDAEYTSGELADAAAYYAATVPVYREKRFCVEGDGRLPHVHMVNLWPWACHWYKPKDRLRDLVRAGALIAAEIDRLLTESQVNGGK